MFLCSKEDYYFSYVQWHSLILFSNCGFFFLNILMNIYFVVSFFLVLFLCIILPPTIAGGEAERGTPKQPPACSGLGSFIRLCSGSESCSCRSLHGISVLFIEHSSLGESGMLGKLEAAAGRRLNIDDNSIDWRGAGCV